MIIKKQGELHLFLTTFVVSFMAAYASCNRTCGGNHFQYPFGFSAGCPIRLNCSRKGETLLHGFPVLNITHDVIQLRVEAKCNRSVQALHSLFIKNYAPKWTNAILLANCNTMFSNCRIPNLNLSIPQFDLRCSSDKETTNCFSELTSDGFFDYKNMSQNSTCLNLLSSILVVVDPNRTDSIAALAIEVMELEWWLEGNHCNNTCSGDGSCSPVKTPAGHSPGFRCNCKNGFDGDGYVNGDGCRPSRASPHCSGSELLSGQCGGPMRYAVIIGGVIAGAILMVCIGLLCCLIRRRSALKAERSTKSRLAEANGINIPIYAYKEIEKATCSFSDKQRLGIGAYGTVYAGKLQNGLWVAIKRIRNRDTTDSIGQVMNEIKLISSVNHPNLVRLLGCSVGNGEQILVYEFMPNGTLYQHLQRERGEGLAWPIRLAIAIETAQAIAHLHSAIDPPIYHRDIKSSNILLDYNFRSKVADFGLSRLGMTEISHISTAPQGTPGYLDPQYHQSFHLSDKSDVYSFGVVLVEIITALKAVDFSRAQNEVNLASLATDRIGKGLVDEIVDPFLDIDSDAWALSSVLKVAEVAFRCLAFHRDMRPSMVEVAAELEEIRSSKWASSSGEMNCTASSDISTCSSSSSNLSEKPLHPPVKKAESEGKGYVCSAYRGDQSMHSM